MTDERLLNAAHVFATLLQKSAIKENVDTLLWDSLKPKQ